MNSTRKKALLTFGKQLAKIRKEKKLSFRKLAALCEKVDHSDIKKYEKGEKNLRLTTIVDLAIGLKVQPKELLNANFDLDEAHSAK